MLERVAAARADFDIAPDDELRALNTPPHAYDTPDAVLVKRLLQDGLPDPPRGQILDELFAELVDDDERAFAERIYLTLDDLRALARRGMDIAAHGYEHRRLALLDEEAQRTEIARSKELLGGDPPDRATGHSATPTAAATRRRGGCSPRPAARSPSRPTRGGHGRTRTCSSYRASTRTTSRATRPLRRRGRPRHARSGSAR